MDHSEREESFSLAFPLSSKAGSFLRASPSQPISIQLEPVPSWNVKLALQRGSPSGVTSSQPYPQQPVTSNHTYVSGLPMGPREKTAC